PLVRHMAVGTGGAHAGTVAVVDRGLELLEHVVAHLVTAGAERLGVGGVHGGVESAPEQHPGQEHCQAQEAQAQVARRCSELPPEREGRRSCAAQQPHCACSERNRVSMSWKPLATSGCALVCTTWHCTQK